MSSEPSYIHGYSPLEQQRLRDQAEVLAPVVIDELQLPSQGSLLEVGCGVGAELALLAQRWPGLHLTGLEIDRRHIEAADEHLQDASELVQGDATRLPFASESFDIVMTVWLLEHVADPRAVMREALRVLRPDGLLICTEVDNATFGFSPPRPAIQEWWDLFCQRQSEAGGNPYIGRHLGRLARELGCSDIETADIHPISSRMAPHRRSELLNYMQELLLSGAAELHASGLADQSMLDELAADFVRVQGDPTTHFEYSAVRLTCRRPTSTPRAQASH